MLFKLTISECSVCTLLVWGWIYMHLYVFILIAQAAGSNRKNKHECCSVRWHLRGGSSWIFFSLRCLYEGLTVMTCSAMGTIGTLFNLQTQNLQTRHTALLLNVFLTMEILSFWLPSFLPWRWLKMRFSAGRELLNASQLLTDDEDVGSFPFCCSFAFRKRCFSCTVQTVSKLRINNADVHTAAVMHCLVTLISVVTVISAFRASCA